MQAIPVTPGNSASSRALIDKALGMPRRGINVGGGRHAPVPLTWDGQGPTPPGWTKSATDEFVAADTSLALKMPAKVVAALALPESQARLTAGERGQLTALLATRREVPE